jgi:hypothetical protein
LKLNPNAKEFKPMSASAPVFTPSGYGAPQPHQQPMHAVHHQAPPMGAEYMPDAAAAAWMYQQQQQQHQMPPPQHMQYPPEMFYGRPPPGAVYGVPAGYPGAPMMMTTGAYGHMPMRVPMFTAPMPMMYSPTQPPHPQSPPQAMIAPPPHQSPQQQQQQQQPLPKRTDGAPSSPTTGAPPMTQSPQQQQPTHYGGGKHPGAYAPYGMVAPQMMAPYPGGSYAPQAAVPGRHNMPPTMHQQGGYQNSPARSSSTSQQQHHHHQQHHQQHHQPTTNPSASVIKFQVPNTDSIPSAASKKE